jgi:hypothetical protein
VHQESQAGFEPNNQILAATIDGGDALSFELDRDLSRLDRTREPRVADVDARERPADEAGSEAEANGLDLG